MQVKSSFYVDMWGNPTVLISPSHVLGGTVLNGLCCWNEQGFNLWLKFLLMSVILWKFSLCYCLLSICFCGGGGKEDVLMCENVPILLLEQLRLFAEWLLAFIITLMCSIASALVKMPLLYIRFVERNLFTQAFYVFKLYWLFLSFYRTQSSPVVCASTE